VDGREQPSVHWSPTLSVLVDSVIAENCAVISDGNRVGGREIQKVGTKDGLELLRD
jgi:hypothetical protein